MLPEVLNKALYRKLLRQFGAVRVAGQGEAMISTAVRGLKDEPRLLISHAGEYYRVCCPFCSDTRYRLYVNHRYASRDAFNRRLLFLAVCYNEGCLGARDNYYEFADMVDYADLATTPIRQGVIVPEEAREVMPPGPTTPLSSLPATHPAVAYLRGRGFDVDILTERYGVSYCTSSRYSLARNRIIIPVTEGGKLKGWQARYAGELDWKGPDRRSLQPKYFSCPDSHFRSRCLYNFDAMKEWETGIIVEGPTDVWRTGLMSGCIFGNSVTKLQQRKFVSVFRSRTSVLLLDPEEFESRTTRELVSALTAELPGRFCAVKLPDGTDPGGLDRSFLRGYIKQEAAARGVRVQFRKHRKAA